MLEEVTSQLLHLISTLPPDISLVLHQAEDHIIIEDSITHLEDTTMVVHIRDLLTLA